MTDTRADLVETVARAICASDFDGDTLVYGEMSPEQRANFARNATAALAAIEAAGPTYAMLAAGEDALRQFIQRRDSGVDIASAIYSAMIAAAKSDDAQKGR